VKKILVVDDDAEMKLYVSSILSARGYEVRSVETGCEALAAMRNEFFDLVILDVLLPDTNGLDLCMKMKDFSPDGHLPVILLSSITDQTVIEHGLKNGADAFMNKPPSPVELVGRTVGLLAAAGVP
jgi:DNA-binding response OmpR family regulator